MTIEFKPDIFSGENFKGLNVLLQLTTYKNRHAVFADISQIENRPLYKLLDKDDQALLIQEFNTQIIQQKSALKADYYVSNTVSQNNEFVIDEAIRFFIQPISIILENSLNDQYFIRSLVNNFNCHEIQRQIGNNWIQFENAGGCSNIENFITGKLQAYNSLPKEAHCYLRCFILLDSDREYKNQPLKKPYEQLIVFLKKHGIIYHFLEKRTMENYMPDTVFTDYKTHNNVLGEWIDAYLSLTPQQKDYLNISRGFTKRDDKGQQEHRNTLQKEVIDLYADVSDLNFDKLNQGFKLPEFKTQFPKNYIDHYGVHKKSLLERTCHQNNQKELIEIVNKIKSLL